jgi:equilibrative nucleoside transporter 1/2/3
VGCVRRVLLAGYCYAVGMVCSSRPRIGLQQITDASRNMFLAAGPYFQKRFQTNDWLLKNFQSAELTVSTIANLGTVLLLTNMQAGASYSKRIIYALVINIIAFTLLAISTRLFTGVSAGVYFSFLVILVFAASIATGQLQNGIYAYVAGFGKEEYTQGIMTGQAVAGVAPPLVQIISVLSAPQAQAGADVPEESSSSAMAYFLTATGISAITLLAFLYLHGSHGKHHRSKAVLDETNDDGHALGPPSKRRVPLTVLFRKTFWLATAVFLTFTVTMVYPVYTQKIDSVHPPSAGIFFKPASFIPLAFFFWNAGDLAGRLLTAIPLIRITHRARLVFILALFRVAFIPLYLLCNIHGRGAKVNSDFFYLGVVQLLFGMSNGYIGSLCMMGAVEYVDEDEREAAGGFMGLMLVGGLTFGSLLSFAVAG